MLDGFLRSPASGIAPWVLMSVLSGPGRFGYAAAAALSLTLLVMWVGSRRGIRVHSLEIFGALFFAAFVALGIVDSPDVIDWLEMWAGELTNGALALFALAGLVVRRPFTMAYARDVVDHEHWDTPVFKRVNYVLTGVWAAAFAFAAIVGAYGDIALKDGDNFWTGWILPLGAIIAATAITEFYPDHARAKSMNESAPSVARALDWVPSFVVGMGIAAWSSDNLPHPVAIALIVIGILAGVIGQKLSPAHKEDQ